MLCRVRACSSRPGQNSGRAVRRGAASGEAHAGTETLSTLNLTADPKSPLPPCPEHRACIYRRKQCQVHSYHIPPFEKNVSQGYKRPVATCLLLPSHGASGGLPSPKSSQSTTCPSGSRAEKSRKPCPNDQHQSIGMAPSFLETPGSRILGHWAWGSA